jgi:hypothetical protein
MRVVILGILFLLSCIESVSSQSVAIQIDESAAEVVAENEVDWPGTAYINAFVTLENNAEFYIYSQNDTSTTYAVRYTITVTNNGTQPIPNLMVSQRSIHLKLFYNNEDANELGIHNGLEPEYAPIALLQGQSATHESGYTLGPDSGLLMRGSIIKVHWTYMGKKSNSILLNLKEQTINKK